MISKPNPDDPLYAFYLALEQAQLGQRLSILLNKIRRVDETDEQAIIRLIQERLATAKILQEFGVAREQFDDIYRNNNVAEDTWRLLYKYRQKTREYPNTVDKLPKK